MVRFESQFFSPSKESGTYKITRNKDQYWRISLTIIQGRLLSQKYAIRSKQKLKKTVESWLVIRKGKKPAIGRRKF